MPKTAKSLLTSPFYLPVLAAAGLFLAGAFSPASADDPAMGLAPDHPKTVLSEPLEFSRGTMMAPEYQPQNSVSGFSLLNPNRFSMHQSYSMNFASGSYGSSSAGLYLNTLSYKLADPLTLSADVGFYTPLYNTSGSFSRSGIQDPRSSSSLVFPHVGLEYKPTDNTTFSLHLFNGQDAYKAYGSQLGPFVSPWAR
jgi:TonB dependent receptor